MKIPTQSCKYGVKCKNWRYNKKKGRVKCYCKYYHKWEHIQSWYKNSTIAEPLKVAPRYLQYFLLLVICILTFIFFAY